MIFERKPPIEKITLRIEEEMTKLARATSSENVWVTHYGANDIHPRNLVYWVCVESDAEKSRLENDATFMSRLRALLTQHNYPIEGRNEVHIGIESQETVDRDAEGNWYWHWK